MAKILRYLLIGFFAVIMAVGSFALGVHRGRSFSEQVASETLNLVQAELSVNHLHRYRELEADLARGCTTEALEKLRIRVNTETLELASLYRQSKLALIKEMLEHRDPVLLKQLPSFKSKYGNAWKEPACTR